MDPWQRTLKKEEQVTLFLRTLYEQHGYKKFRMGRFEEYDLYLENKNFLKSRHIITFNDLDGRVLALKPDVTLSIVKNTHADEHSAEKFYYLENVYRLDKPSGSYREISQLGLEYIGAEDRFAAGEVLSLAARTLKAISESFRMQLSHVGFVLSLLDGLAIDAAAQRALLECMRRKNGHELRERAAALGITPAAANLLGEVCALCGPFEETLQRARAVAITPSMTEALDLLQSVYEVMRAGDCAEGITLDFSLVNDMDYYSGIAFQGYVEGVPRAVLAGGCYANLLKKFGRALDAIGFAVYLNELSYLYEGRADLDADVLLLYGPDDDLQAVARQQQSLIDRGLRVRCEQHPPRGLRCGRALRLGEAMEDA